MITMEVNAMDAIHDAIAAIGSDRFVALDYTGNILPHHRQFVNRAGYRIQKNGEKLYLVKC